MKTYNQFYFLLVNRQIQNDNIIIDLFIRTSYFLRLCNLAFTIHLKWKHILKAAYLSIIYCPVVIGWLHGSESNQQMYLYWIGGIWIKIFDKFVES